ncbi:hypothetical protein E3N88_26170 [Mikania micrantha]|uniref:Uncharacterized protein n=1 Tax=Mikania micrantha TaxID=192012 RepID=A0A5N6N9J6_9ASTR|nr:hypothetical protein E3N88_26170 [Mikania micrantha]
MRQRVEPIDSDVVTLQAMDDERRWQMVVKVRSRVFFNTMKAFDEEIVGVVMRQRVEPIDSDVVTVQAMGEERR